MVTTPTCLYVGANSCVEAGAHNPERATAFLQVSLFLDKLFREK